MFIPSFTHFPKSRFSGNFSKFEVLLNSKFTHIKNRQFSGKTSIIAPEILKTLHNELDSRVIGQPNATKAIVDALHLHAAELSDPRLPIANFLFLGPTGVGKTELAKVLAELLFGKRNALLPFDMAKYTHECNVSALVGTTQGYVGYADGGLLTSPVLQDPDRIILFDELEKAHSAIYKVLLSVMGSGEITDNRGEIALFNRCIIISTSNLCSLKIQELFSKNFSSKEIEEKLRPELMKHFSPEFYGRITPIIFNPASETHLSQVIDKMLKEVKIRVDTKTGILLNISDCVKNYIETEGFSPELGFRPTARFIEQKIVLPIAKLINEHQVTRGQILNVKHEEGELRFSVAKLIPASTYLDSQMQTIKKLIGKKRISDAIVLYENLHSETFAQKDIWPDEFVKMSLEVGKLCREESKNPQKVALALKIFTALTEKGNNEAKAFLGEMYFFGRGVPENDDEALRLFKEAGAFDNPLANFYIGKMYLAKLGGLEYNPYLAEQFFDKAAAKGSAEVVNWVGVVYEKSKRIWVKEEKFINCYKRAAELGSAKAYYSLGLYYLNEHVDGKITRAKGIDCLLTSGNLGFKEAYLELGELYRRGIPHDIKLAEHYEARGGKVPAPVVVPVVVVEKKVELPPTPVKTLVVPIAQISKLERLKTFLWGPKI